MRTITATVHHPQSPKRRVVVAKDGNSVGSDVVNPASDSDIKRRICKAFSVPFDLVVQALNALNTAVNVPDSNALPTGPIEFTVRPRLNTQHKGLQYNSFADAMAAPCDPDSVILWNDARFALLDIDVDAPIHPQEAARAASLVRPRPHLWHQSHNGGLHLYYEAAHGYEALDLAACAAVWMRQLNGLWRCELNDITRHPLQTGHSVHEQQPDSDISNILAWVKKDSDSADVAALIEDKGWTIGQRINHEDCPIDPKKTRRGMGAVQIGASGIYCYRCSALDLKRGSRRPGFVPWSYFINGALCSVVRNCVANFTHWAQARIVLEQEFGFPEAIARRAYSVLLRLWHGDEDDRVKSVFAAGTDLIRRKGIWTYLDGTPLKISHGKRELAALPALQNESGQAIGPLLDRFCQGTDLSAHGYNNVEVIHGVAIWGHKLPYNDGRIATVRYQGEQATKPRYRKPSDRMSIDNARQVYEATFPELPWEYLQLLICARGIAEGSDGMPPFIYTSGVTGAGKTQTTHLAAATIGDYNSEVNWSFDNQRFRQGILEATQRGTYCTINEIKKGAQRVHMTLPLAMEPILTLTEHSTSHQMYTGPVALGRLPVVIMTETECPPELLKCAQLTRRLIACRLHKRLDWDDGPGAKVQLLRTLGSDMCKAADSLVTWMIDLHFSEPKTLADIAESLGFQRMSSVAEEELRIKEKLLALYAAVCKAPDAAPAHQRRWGGRGWKLVDQSKGSDEVHLLDYLYFTLSDVEDFTRCGAISEHDWTNALKLKGNPPVECQIKAISPQHRSQVGLRFRRGDLINEEIK